MNVDYETNLEPGSKVSPDSAPMAGVTYSIFDLQLHDSNIATYLPYTKL